VKSHLLVPLLKVERQAWCEWLVVWSLMEDRLSPLTITSLKRFPHVHPFSTLISGLNWLELVQ